MTKRKFYSMKVLSILLTFMIILSVAPIVELSVYAADNNSMATAKQISTNTTYTDNLSVYGEEDYYWFSLSSNSKVSISFSHSTIDSSSTYWYVELYNADGDKLSSIESKGNTTNLTSSNAGVPSGNYYIKISKGSYSEINYSFKVNSTSESYWETEKNDSYGTSNSISMNTEYNGSLALYGDVDYYKFSLNSSSKISITFKHSTIDSSSTYWYVELYNTDGDKLTSIESKGNTTNLTSSNAGVPSGNYYIKISKGSYSEINYSFKVNSTSESYWETEKNDSYGTSDSISMNTEYNGSLALYGDVDYYKFSLNSSSKISLTFKHSTIDSSSTYWYVELYNTDGDKLTSIESKGNTTNLTSDEKQLSTGDYYIKISKGSYSDIDYSFSVNTPQVVPTSISVAPSTLTLNKGDTYNLSASVYPSNATNKSITWSSADSTIASVDSNGKVTAKSSGYVIITAKTWNGKTATCGVTVPNDEITISFTPSSVSTYVGNSSTVNIKFTGDGIYDLQASIGDSNICSASWGSVDYSTGSTSITVTGKKAGSTSVTIHLRNSAGTSLYSKSFNVSYTGMRAGEACGIINSDIDFENRVIHLQRGVKEVHVRENMENQGRLEVQVGKLKSATSKRDIPLNDTAIEMIRLLQEEVYLGEDTPLIPDENGNFTNPRNMRTRFQRILKAAGLEKRGLHVLRHTFATTLINGIKQPDGSLKTLTVKQVADLLGHTTSEITEIYYVKRDNNKLSGLTDGFNI